MKLLLHWLYEFLPTKPSAQEVAAVLGNAGLEVARYEYLGSGFEDIVIAKIESTKPHPNADRLTLCQVTDGTRGYHIVCGARNMKTGDRVALAREGATIPNGLKIKKSKIRGEESEGMLCSESELKFRDESEGILILPPEAPLGQLLGEYLGRNDWCFELELTPNRGDALSIIGIAREVAIGLKVSPKVPVVGGEGPSESPLATNIHDSFGSPRYVLREVDQVNVSPSPDWMRLRLESCGIRSINNLVDVTNYILLEWGQPLHAFDREKVSGAIVVRRAKEGEKILCLDDIERTLTAEDLVIADQKGAIAIAGVMGGARTAVSEKTTAILLESAHFDPKSVRKTSKRLMLHTEASHRFERWVDPAGVWNASTAAVELLGKVSGGKPLRSIDLRGPSMAPKKITLRQSTIHRILGTDVPQAGEYLAQLGLSVEKRDTDWQVEIPTRRPDLLREIDLVEEVARIHGYNRFASRIPPMNTGPVIEDETSVVDRVKSVCQAVGLREVRTYSFATEEQNNSFRSNAAQEPLPIANPLMAEFSFLRLSLIPSLLDVWRHNRARQVKGMQIFEVGRTYSVADSASKTPAKEETHLTILCAGEVETKQWYRESRTADFFDGKGLVEILSDRLGFAPIQFRKEGVPTFLHPGQAAMLMWRNQEIGYAGMLHPKYGRIWETGPTMLVDVKLDPLMSSMNRMPKWKPVSPYPMVERDLAFIANEEISTAEIDLEIQKLKEPLLLTFSLFDVYRGQGVPEAHRSLAYSFCFGSQERTLTDTEVDGALSGVVALLEKRFGAKLRA